MSTFLSDLYILSVLESLQVLGVIWEQVWRVDWAGSVRCTSEECTLAFQSLPDPNRAAGLGARAPFLPGRWTETERVHNEAKQGIGLGNVPSAMPN